VRPHSRIGIAAWLLLASAGPAMAQGKTGTTIGTFLTIEPNARVAAMGNAGGAADFGIEAYWYNPAAIARTEKHEVSFSHLTWIASIDYNHVAAAIPAGKAGTVVASLTSLNSGKIDVRTVSQPLGTGESFDVADVAVGLGLARPITDRFSVGARITYLQERIWHSSVSSGVIDLGTVYRVNDAGLVIGAAMTNLGVGGQYDGRDLSVTYDQDPNSSGDNGTIPATIFTDKFGVPITLRFGLALPVRINQANRLRFAVDALHPSDNAESMNLGAEYEYKGVFALRAGWQQLFLSDSEAGLTLGAGFKGEMNNALGFHLDYAYTDQGRLEQAHRFSVGIDF